MSEVKKVTEHRYTLKYEDKEVVVYVDSDGYLAIETGINAVFIPKPMMVHLSEIIDELDGE